MPHYHDVRRLDMGIERLVVHGICHLMGYDHATWDQHSQMFAKECQILRHLYTSKLPLRSRWHSRYHLVHHRTSGRVS